MKGLKKVFKIGGIVLLALIVLGLLAPEDKGSETVAPTSAPKAVETEAPPEPTPEPETEVASDEPVEESTTPDSLDGLLGMLLGDSGEGSAEPKEYTRVTVSQMVTDLEGNAMNASDRYSGKYLEITGRLSNIDSSGKYFTLDPSDSDFCMTGVQCYIQTNEQKSQVVSMKDGDIVTLRGKCTRVSDVFGYYLNIDSIDGYAASEVTVTSSASDPLVCTAAQLISELESNAMKAEMTYKGQYLKLSGQISGFDSDGAYLNIDPVNSYFNLTPITVYLKNDEVRAAARQLSKGDVVTVTGTCTDVGEFLGYSLNAESISR